MKYNFLEVVDEMGYGEDIDVDVDFQKLYDFVKSVNWSKSSLETDLDILKEFEKYNNDYIVGCYDLYLGSSLGADEYNDNVLNEVTKDFTEWIKNKNQ